MWNFQSCPLSPHRRNSSREKTKSGALNSTAPERPNNNNNTPAGAGQSPRATNKRPLGCRRQWSAGQTGPHGADAQASVKYDWSPRHGAARHGTPRHATPLAALIPQTDWKSMARSEKRITWARWARGQQMMIQINAARSSDYVKTSPSAPLGENSPGNTLL